MRVLLESGKRGRDEPFNMYGIVSTKNVAILTLISLNILPESTWYARSSDKITIEIKAMVSDYLTFREQQVQIDDPIISTYTLVTSLKKP